MKFQYAIRGLFSLFMVCVLPAYQPVTATAKADALDQIMALRAEGNYQEALTVSIRLLESLEFKTNVKQYELDDAKRYNETLVFIVGLPDSLQSQMAVADWNISSVYELYDVNKLQEAQAAAEKALRIQQQILGPDHLEVAYTYGLIGFFYHELYNFAKADEYYTLATKLQRPIIGDMHPDMAELRNNIAVLTEDQGDYARAEQIYRLSLAVDIELLGEMHEDVATDYNNLGTLLQTQGRYQEAARCLIRALKIRRKALEENDPAIAESYNNLGVLWEVMGRDRDAEELYSKAVTTIVDGANTKNANYPQYISNLGGIQYVLKKFAEAESSYNKAIAIRIELSGENDPRLASTYFNFARLLQDQQNFSQSEDYYKYALEIDRSHPGVRDGYIARDLYYLGTMYIDSDQWDKAEGSLVEACETFEYARSRIGAAGLGRSLFTAAYSPYESLCAIYLRSDRAQDAWIATERDRGRTVLDMLRMGDLAEADRLRERELARSIEVIEIKIAVLTAEDSSESQPERHVLLQELQRAKAKWVEFQALLAKKHPVDRGGILTLKQVQSCLTDSSAIIGWYIDRYVYFITNSGDVIWEKCKSNNSPNLVSDYLRAVSNSSGGWQDFAESATTLYETFLAPLQSHLDGVKRLYVIPSGAMTGIPIDALMPDHNTYVIDKWDVCYISSASALATLKERPPSDAGKSLLAVGDPPLKDPRAQAASVSLTTRGADAEARYANDAEKWTMAGRGNKTAIADLDPLPATRDEVLEIAAMFDDAQVLVGADASEQNLDALSEADRLKEFRYLHFAMHAIPDDEFGEESCLILSQAGLPDPVECAINGDPVVDGRLSMAEVIDRWKLDADLVTLSACKSALGQEVRGEGYIGLTHAFVRAGAKSVVVTLWSVEDRVTSELMKRFYSNLITGMPKSLALREAKIWVRDLDVKPGEIPTYNPFFWAPFVIFGLPD